MSPARLSLRFALIGLLLLNTTLLAAAEIDRSRAAGVMAAYLRHIASLTNWPEEETAGTILPISIGLIGEDPNGVIALIRDRAESSEGLLAQGRPIRVVALEPAADDADTLEQLLSCALLFLSEGAEVHWQKIQPLVQGRPIVTVSEMEGFVEEGGMVEYFIEHKSGKVRLKVNLPVMHATGVSFSAELLALKAVILLGEREGAR